MVEIAIIGGSGMYSVKGFRRTRTAVVKTPYGGSPEVALGNVGGREVAFLPRHGRGHTTPPHMINYRANVWALKKLGVKRVFATLSCGSMDARMRPGELAVPAQFIDFTKCRPMTFHEGGRAGVAHVDVSEPYCPELRDVLIKGAKRAGLRVHPRAVYACTEGPRFETAAEAKALRALGADIVGMTNVPECVLARELGMCYAAVGIITNFSSGISRKKLTYTEVAEMMDRKMGGVRRLLLDAVSRGPEKRSCPCAHALEGAVVRV